MIAMVAAVGALTAAAMLARPAGLLGVVLVPCQATFALSTTPRSFLS